MSRTFFKYWRTLIPASFFILVTVLTARLEYPLPADAVLLSWLSRLDPILLISQVSWYKVIPSWAWLPLLVVLTSLFMGRAFCGWLCPVGGLLALLNRPMAALSRQTAGFKLFHNLRGTGYYWLILLLLLVIMGTNWPLLLTPYTILSHEITRLLFGHVPWLFIFIVVIGFLTLPRFWCIHICPTGLFLSAIARFRFWRLTIKGPCTRCNNCTGACPTQAITPQKGLVDEKCILCFRCWEKCPGGLVTWGQERTINTPAPRYMQSRRNFIKKGIVAFTAAGLLYLRQPAPGEGILRPPGALPEAEFVSVCSRCGRCIKACPNQALSPAPFTAGLAAFDTPQFIPRNGRCDICLLCQEVCPTGAISHSTLEQVKIGTAVLDKNRCQVWTKGTECLICVEQCPFRAVRMDESRRPYLIAEKCIGCGACENSCPIDKAAIEVQKD